MKIMVVAGEASGDLHGSHLAAELKKREPDLELFGMGGPMMAHAGVELLYDPTAISAIGFIEVLRSVQILRRVLSRFAEELEKRRPDCLVLIDFPEFNMRLAEVAKTQGIPVVYYFSPSAWAWRKGRAKTVAGHATKVCAVLPFEAQVYREAGASVEYVGHPLVDVAKPTLSPDEARKAFGCEGKHPVIALLPGSRKQELDNHVAPMLAAAEQLLEKYPNAFFLMALAHTMSEEQIKEKLPKELPVRVVRGQTYDVLGLADAAASKMGTVTLEAALIGCPIVALYRTSRSTYLIARQLYRGRYVALPNIIAGREIVPELLQDDASPQRIAAEVAALLSDEKRRQAIIEGYQEVRRILGGPGAVGRAADAVLSVARAQARRAEGGTRGS